MGTNTRAGAGVSKFLYPRVGTGDVAGEILSGGYGFG
jgi:hypothetical protein